MEICNVLSQWMVAELGEKEFRGIMPVLVKRTLFETTDLVDIAIKRLQAFEPEEGYYLAFSGGKDSCVIKALAELSGVKFDAHYNMTTIDPPEMMQFIRRYHSDVIVDMPKEPFLKMLVHRGFPQRQRRWCCAELKERGGEGRFVITGVRWAESYKRSQRRMIESCYKDNRKRYLNLIIEWSDEDVWEFLKSNKIPYCSLYDEGWKRIGCLFCPMGGKHRLIEAKRYPGFVRVFKDAFQKLYDKKKAEGKTSIDRWANGEEMFNWWINEDRTSVIPDQGVLFE